jgi:RNA polymerase sigma-B factor
MGAAAPLLRDWDWLQEQVIPPLLKSRRPVSARTWSIGSTADAVAVTVAFAHAAGARSEGFRAFVSDPFPDSGTVSFGRADVGVVPPADRCTWFRCQDHRWVPEPVIADHVILGQPPGSVDLVTVRPAGRPASVTAAVDRLKRGGHLLFIEPPDRPPPRLRPVDTAGRLFKKDGRARAPAEDSPTDIDGTETLSRRQMEQDLVTRHLRLARALAHRFLHRGEPSDELEQVAFLALVKASHRFDPRHNTTFATYATVSILGELKRHFRDKTWMLRVPRSTQERYLAIKEAREELGHQLGTPPTVAQIAAHLEVSEEAILEAMEAGGSYWTASLDVRGPDGERSIDIPVSDGALDRALDRQRLRVLLARLDDRQQLILKRLYFDGYTQQRVANELGASQMQVSRLLARTTIKLRQWYDSDEAAVQGEDPGCRLGPPGV